MSEEMGSLPIVKRFRIEGGDAIREAARRRGITATLYLYPAGRSSIAAMVVNHRTNMFLYEMLPPDTCRGLFGFDEAGIYDVTIEPTTFDPGAPEDTPEES